MLMTSKCISALKAKQNNCWKLSDKEGKSPLSEERQQARLYDLKLMFESISKHHPDAKVVHGGSWLYNLKSYQRLFPEIFTTNMKVEEIPFPKTSGIWGQFLNSEGEVITLAQLFALKVLFLMCNDSKIDIVNLKNYDEKNFQFNYTFVAYVIYMLQQGIRYHHNFH